MATLDDIESLISDYQGKELTIATVCSHSSLQIFSGAKGEGFRTVGIVVGEKRKKVYESFPLATPDEFIVVDDYKEILDRTDELAAMNAVLIPHGSFVEYLGADNFKSIAVPTFGNRNVLEWESDRDMEREWLEGAGVPMPKKIIDPREIDRPALVKYHGAKGGRGFFIAKDHDDFKKRIQEGEPYTIQEYIIGTRYYIHYFYSPISNRGFPLTRVTYPGIAVPAQQDFRSHLVGRRNCLFR